MAVGDTTFTLPDGTYFGDGSAVAQPPPESAAPLQTVVLHKEGSGAPMTLTSSQTSWPNLVGMPSQVRPRSLFKTCQDVWDSWHAG